MVGKQPGVTELLSSWRNGDPAAGERAFSLVYGELRALAQRYLRQEAAGHTLQPTALVHEAFLRLPRRAGIADRAHLIGIAARLMRQILVNHALRKRTLRRGGDGRRIPLDPAVALFEERCGDLVALDEALTRLAEVDARQAQVVELRFFGGLTTEETARTIGCSQRTVERDWTVARLWLRREVSP